jgi:hypothetical protein
MGANDHVGDQREAERLERIGLAVRGIEVLSRRMSQEVVLTGFSVRLQGDCLITAKAVVAREKRVVAFVGGVTLENAMEKLHAMMRDGGLEWKPDKFG